MSDAAQYRRELVGEARRIHQLLSEATDRDLGTAPACPGWTVHDVGRHVEITPRTVAANIEAHLAMQQSPSLAPLGPEAGSRQVLQSLLAGTASLDAAMGQLGDADLEGLLPGPAGPMPARAALDLALTELTLHRCDIELGLGIPPAIDEGVATRLVDVLQAWLLLTAPTDPVPGEPWCVQLRVHAHTWSFSFDGSRWSDEECSSGEVLSIESAGQAVLALAGRAHSSASGTDGFSRLKEHLPGP